MYKTLLALLAAALLTACGGGDPATTQNQAPRQAAARASAQATDYSDIVQRLYVAYFGRPADAGGLTNFEAQLASMGATTDIQTLEKDYGNNPAIQDLVNSFGYSAESKALYNGDTDAFVTAIYRNLLNRVPPAGDAGKAFWVNAIDHEGLQRSKAALSILTGALANTTDQGRVDAQTITNKTSVARSFTIAAPLDTYKGDTAAALARTMLASVDQNTDIAAFQSTIANTLQQMAAAAGSIYAGTYSGSYGGDDQGNFTFTVAKDGTITGSGKSNVYGTILVISGTLGSSGGDAVQLQGTIGPFNFSGALTSAGNLSGSWSGLGASGSVTARRIGG